MTVITITRDARCKDCIFLKPEFIGKKKRHRCSNTISPRWQFLQRLRDLVCDQWKMAIIILFATASNAQTIEKSQIHYQISFSDECFERESYVVINSENEIQVYGDTLKLLQMAMQNLKEQSDRNFDKWRNQEKLEHAAIDFANTVPIGLKYTKQWQKYAELLKKKGYKVHGLPPKKLSKTTTTIKYKKQLRA